MVRIAIVAGEASSDQLAAHLINAIKKHVPDAQFIGIGGTKMQREGFDAWWLSEKLSVRGYAEVLRHYREISGIRRQLLRRLTLEKPDVFIGVDGYDFNIWLEGKLKAAGIPTIHYVSPSIWAWRKHRLKAIVKSVSHLLALYPFEPALYEGTPVNCTYVGHPLADEIEPNTSKRLAREQLEIPLDIDVIALLPGSRQSELQYMAETFIQTAMLLHQRNPNIRFLVPLISRETRTQFETALWKLKADELPITLMFGHAQDAVAASDVTLVASGTATLETALIGRPMVIAYKMSKWTWRIMRNMGYLPWVGLPNILATRYVVPEFLQDDASPENLSQALENTLKDRVLQQRIHSVFLGIHQQLRQDTAQKAASGRAPLPKLCMSTRICGVDEAGRGPLAGPVCAAAVVLDPEWSIGGLADSKKLTETRREILAIQIKERALSFCIAWATVEEIDRLNILQATMLAMERAVMGLSPSVGHAMIDGNRIPNLSITAQAIVRGDQTVPAISAASILAKTARDSVMRELHDQYPEYGFKRHKGYDTPEHRRVLMQLGPISAHRRSFSPVRDALSSVTHQS